MPVEFSVCPEHRSQVRFAPESSSMDEFGVEGITLDLSSGGLGFVARQFLPRHCEGIVRIFAPSQAPIEGRPHQPAVVRIEHRAKVRRVWMDTRDGSYSIGLAFLDPTPQLEGVVNDMLRDMNHQQNKNAPSQAHGEETRHA